MSQKQNFVCPHCNKIFKNPILLPCYDTICEHHLREEMVLKQESIECKTCKKTFNLDGLKSGPNKHLQSQLDNDIHLSDEEKSLKNALLESCANFDQMSHEYHDLDSESIKAHFNRLRRQLDERRKSLIGKIDEIYFEMIKKTTNCEESVLKNLANNFKAVDVLQLPNRKNLANEINEKFREVNLELNLLRKQLNKSENEIAHLKIKLDEIAEISKNFASSNYFEFKHSFNHEHFGLLHLNELRSNIRSQNQDLAFPTIKIENAETMQGIVENNEVEEEEEEEEDVIFCYQNSIKRKRIDDEEILLQSQILTSKQLSSELIRLCEFSPNDRFTLLYRGTRDGFGSRDFHSKCDNHSNTLTICKTSQKKRRDYESSKLKAPEFAFICGGFTTVKWESTYKWKHVSDPNAFVFSLTNKDNKPCKLSVKPNKCQYAVSCHSGSGPRFGDDIFIADDSNLTMSSSKLGETYKRPEHVRAEIEAFSFLAGTEEFYLSEIEVHKKGE
jgi:hypothetical protein